MWGGGCFAGGWQCPRKCLSAERLASGPVHWNSPAFLLHRKALNGNQARPFPAGRHRDSGCGPQTRASRSPRIVRNGLPHELKTYIFTTPCGAQSLSSQRKTQCQTIPKARGLSGALCFSRLGVSNCAFPEESQDAPRSQDCHFSSKSPSLLCSLRFWFPILGGSSPAVKSWALPSFLFPTLLPPSFLPSNLLQAGSRPRNHISSVTSICKVRVSRPQEGWGSRFNNATGTLRVQSA